MNKIRDSKSQNILSKIEKNKRVYIFIDSANVWSVVKSVKKIVDYGLLKKYFKDNLEPTELKIFYYEAYPENGTRDYSLDSKHRYFTFLKKGLGFNVRKKVLKQIKHDDGSIVEKGNMDVELVIDAVHNINNYDIAILFSGDSDFLSLIKYIRNRSKKVFVFSSKNNVSSELRTGGDGYFEMKKIDEIWGGGLKHKER